MSADMTPRWRDRARKRLNETLELLAGRDDKEVALLRQLLADAQFPRSVFEWYVQTRKILGYAPSVEGAGTMCCPTCQRP
jgi:hypothetical protein